MPSVSNDYHGANFIPVGGGAPPSTSDDYDTSYNRILSGGSQGASNTNVGPRADIGAGAGGNSATTQFDESSATMFGGGGGTKYTGTNNGSHPGNGGLGGGAGGGEYHNSPLSMNGGGGVVYIVYKG
jgi:hypothetical protein